MAKYIIDREEAYNVLTEYYHHSTEGQHLALREALSRIPAADVVEVVRCKDCLWFVPSAYDDFWCSAKEAGITKGMCMPGGNDYCSDGKRRK